MIRITEIDTVVEHIVFSGEVLINLFDFNNVLKSDIGKQIEMEECLITPYYIQDNKRMELYQYEFCICNECNFEDYILRLTGKRNFEDIPEEIINLRKICFAKISENNKIFDYLNFLFKNQELRREVEQNFDNFNEVNLYATVF
ncbi:MAG: hypothetical protein NC412_10970 [Roseburia sp.]|nr:hypothetical protein [Roseburia sp.]MCM1279339.1 hypothetical protein [Robinsoniella sp.]